MWRIGRMLVGCVAGLVAVAGCANNPYATPSQSSAAWSSAAPPQVSPSTDAQQRLSQLDANNRDLHAQLARSQQQLQLSQEQLAMLRKQLSDTAVELERTQSARQQAEKQVETLTAAARQRGGATITANNSLQQSLQLVEVPGAEVRQEGDVVRIEVPADNLFSPGTAQLLPAATAILDRVAEAITRNYPQQRVGIEAHTDRVTRLASVAANDHQLSASEGLAVLDQLTRRNRIPAEQLFVMAVGSNYPRYSMATAAGAARNRRIEIVVYPERWSTN